LKKQQRQENKKNHQSKILLLWKNLFHKRIVKEKETDK
jgi:hypothetical protein